MVFAAYVAQTAAGFLLLVLSHKIWREDMGDKFVTNGDVAFCAFISIVPGSPVLAVVAMLTDGPAGGTKRWASRKNRLFSKNMDDQA
jgi:hypothetical protein